MSVEPISDGTVYTYARVSEDDRKSGSCSIRWQQDQIGAWLVAHNERSDGEFVDNGVSASVALDERPDGKELVAEATHKGDTIIVAKFDRIFRDVEDFRSRLRLWCEQGVRLVCLAEGLDLTTPTGRMIATMVVAVAEWERETIGERIRAAIATRKEHGLRSSSVARYGWQFVPFGPERKDGTQECRLEPNEREQWVIRRIVALRGECKSLRAIAEELTRGKHPTRNGGPWIHSTVQGILEEIELHLAPSAKATERLPCEGCGYLSCCCPLEVAK